MNFSSADLALAGSLSAERLWAALGAMAHHGALPGGGVNRQALSPEDGAARRTLVTWGRAIGLAASSDPAGNLFLRYEGCDPALPPVLIGSHLDSQPTGGRYDGAYGVLAAFEALRTLREANITPLRSIELVAWMNEEGSRFAPGMMGSAAFAGARSLDAILDIRDEHGIPAGDALAAIRAAEHDIPARPLGGEVFAYIEPHIEQGPVLERAGIPLGIVSGIQGKLTYRITVTGEENHAGTAPRAARRDALMAAVRMIQAMNVAFHDTHDRLRFTVGRLNVSPNAPSVVPARVEFSIDLRHPDKAILEQAGTDVASLCAAQAQPCDVTVAQLVADPPLVFPEALRNVLGDAASALDVPAMAIPSGAGHDAKYLHLTCPSAMIFIPCHNGISHREDESIEPDDATMGARTLLLTTMRLANCIALD